jgi:hypothetical protein
LIQETYRHSSKSFAEMILWPRAPPAKPVAAMEETRLILTIMDRKAAHDCQGEYSQKISAFP